MLNTLREPDLGERAPGQRSGSEKTAMQHRPSASRHPNISRLENFEGEQRGVEQVAHFMGDKPGALVPACRFPIEGGLILLASELRHRARDGVVEAAVQHSEVVRADARIRLHSELGDRLAYIAVVVHDLRHGKPLQQKFVPVLKRALSNVGTGC